MNKIPLTYFPGGAIVTDEWLPIVFAEFAANGAENMVINELMSARFLTDPRFYGRLEHMARNAGLKLFEIHAPFGECWDLNCSVQARRETMLQDHIRVMRYAAEIGCKTYVIHVGAWDCLYRPEVSLEKMRDLARASIEVLLPEAEKLGLILAVENSFEMSNSTDEVLGLITQFDSPFIGCCFDAGHANFMAPARDGKPKAYPKYLVELSWRGNLIEEPAALEKLLPHIVTCHLHDNNGLDDQHQLPGNGTTDWADLMPKLLKAPRLVSCQCEVAHFKHHIPIKVLCETMNRLVYG